MNKAELVRRIAQAADLTPAQAARALVAVLEGIQVTLSRRERVIINGLGTFTVRLRASRKGRHPRTGHEVASPAHRRVTFRAGTRLRQAAQAGAQDRGSPP